MNRIKHTNEGFRVKGLGCCVFEMRMNHEPHQAYE
jgi:hypothetical protein